MIGSCGSEEKIKYAESIGYDGVFNYKTEDYDEALKRLAPEGIDCYFDNVRYLCLMISSIDNPIIFVMYTIARSLSFKIHKSIPTALFFTSLLDGIFLPLGFSVSFILPFSLVSDSITSNFEYKCAIHLTFAVNRSI